MNDPTVGGPPGVSLPLAPLVRYAERVHGETLTRRRFGVLLGYPDNQSTRAMMTRWARDGVPERAAERAATRLGVHPSFVWGDEWWQITEQLVERYEATIERRRAAAARRRAEAVAA